MKISFGLIGAEQQYCPAVALLPKQFKNCTQQILKPYSRLRLAAGFGNDWQSFHLWGSDSDSNDSLQVPRGKAGWET